MDATETTQFIRAAKDHYNPELPYHNWQHAEHTIDALKELMARMQKRGLRFKNPNTLLVAAAWHNAGYGGEFKTRRFESEEEYAAHLATKHLEQRRVASTEIEIIRNAILATKHGTLQRTLAGKALHRADIDNIGGPYTNFVDANGRLYQEAQVLGNPISLDEHRDNTRHFVRFTIEEARRELPALGEHTGTPLAFDTQAERNLATYADAA